MYWYLKNLQNETISQNNLYEILRNSTTFREISRNKVQRNFVFREIKKSHFATTLPQGNLYEKKPLFGEKHFLVHKVNQAIKVCCGHLGIHAVPLELSFFF
jgi:hypothetical protein